MHTTVEAPPGTELESLFLRTIKRSWSAIFSSALWRSLPGHLTSQQLFVLSRLKYGSAQPSELAREQHVGMSAVTGVIDGLVARGLVERRHDEQDRRAVRLDVTAEGRALLEEAQVAVLDSTRELLAPLSSEARERLLIAMRDLSEAIDSARDGAAPAVERTQR